MANLTAAKLRRRARRSPQPADTSTDASLSDDASDERLPRHDSVTLPNPRSRFREYSMPVSLSPSPSSTARLFIASLGNPPPLHSTRHSAGHIALRSLIAHLYFPAPRRDPAYAGGAVSTSPSTPAYTFYQSPTYMNTSGPALLKAWNNFSSTSTTNNTTSGNLGLVLLHDELELPLGQLKLKNGASSAKGHNGIKSVQASLQGAGLLDRLGGNFVRVGVGIGRPVSRDRDDVSAFVLGQMTAGERDKIEGAADVLAGLLAREAERIGRGG